MKCFFKEILIWGIITGACFGCPIIEDKSTDDSFGCEFRLNFSEQLRKFIKESLKSNKIRVDYSMEDFLGEGTLDLSRAANFLLKEDQEGNSFAFSDLDKFIKFLNQLKTVMFFYNERYEKFYNGGSTGSMCGIGKWGDIPAYIFAIDECLKCLLDS